MQQASVQQAMSQAQKKRKAGQAALVPHDEDKFGIGDRVFVCLGKLKDNGISHAWIMTLNKTYDEVTFWEVGSPQRFQMYGRIIEGEEQRLQAYLSPNLTESEKKEIEKRREFARQESLLQNSEFEQEPDQDMIFGENQNG